MTRKPRLTRAAEKIGTVAGRADRTAHKVAKAAQVKIRTVVGRADRTTRRMAKVAQVASEELRQIKKKVEGLAHDLRKASERVQRSLR